MEGYRTTKEIIKNQFAFSEEEKETLKTIMQKYYCENKGSTLTFMGAYQGHLHDLDYEVWKERHPE